MLGVRVNPNPNFAHTYCFAIFSFFHLRWSNLFFPKRVHVKSSLRKSVAINVKGELKYTLEFPLTRRVKVHHCFCHVCQFRSKELVLFFTAILSLKGKNVVKAAEKTLIIPGRKNFFIFA